MKKIITLLFFVVASFVSYGQCSTVGAQISSSDTAVIQLYQAGFFNIPSGFDNICEWEVTSFSGQIIHRDTTSGGANDQSTTIFNHSVPITDSMKVTIFITNNTEGITCTINDTLYWKETEVIPGAFIGNWDVLSNNIGVEAPLNNTTKNPVTTPYLPMNPIIAPQNNGGNKGFSYFGGTRIANPSTINVEVYPNPTKGMIHLDLQQVHDNITVVIRNVLGQTINTYHYSNTQAINLNLIGESGFYFLALSSGDERIVVIKVLKE